MIISPRTSAWTLSKVWPFTSRIFTRSPSFEAFYLARVGSSQKVDEGGEDNLGQQVWGGIDASEQISDLNLVQDLLPRLNAVLRTQSEIVLVQFQAQILGALVWLGGDGGMGNEDLGLLVIHVALELGSARRDEALEIRGIDDIGKVKPHRLFHPGLQGFPENALCWGIWKFQRGRLWLWLYNHQRDRERENPSEKSTPKSSHHNIVSPPKIPPKREEWSEGSDRREELGPGRR